MSVEQLLDDVQDELGALWGSGLALPGPERPHALRSLADRLDQLQLEWTAAQLRALAGALEVEASREAHEHLQRVAAWARTFRHGWALQRARERVAAGPEGAVATVTRPAGVSGRFTPIGLERAGNRWSMYAHDVAGRVVVFADEVGDVSTSDPLREALTSRLFQDRMRYAEVLAHDVVLHEHPASVSGGQTVFRPSFYTRPTLGDRASAGRARVGGGRVQRGQLSRVELQVRPSPDGWRFEHDGGDLTIAATEVLAFNLWKWVAVEDGPLDAVVLGRADGASLIETLDRLGDPCIPAVDPSAILWAPDRLVHATGDWALGNAALGALRLIRQAPRAAGRLGDVFGWFAGQQVERGPIPTEAEGPQAGHAAVWRHLVAGASVPEALRERFTRNDLSSHPTLQEVAARGLSVGGAPGRALLEAHLAQLRRGVKATGLLPDPEALWAFADALARLRDLDPSESPIAGLGLPPEVRWLAAVQPLVAWLRGGEPDEEIAAALLLILAAGDGDRFWFSPGTR